MKFEMFWESTYPVSIVSLITCLVQKLRNLTNTKIIEGVLHRNNQNVSDAFNHMQP